MERLKRITLDDVIFFALVVFALGSCISGHLGKNAEMAAIALCTVRLLRGNIPVERLRVAKNLAVVLAIFYGTMTISALWSGNFTAAVKLCPILDWGFETLLVFCVLVGVQKGKQINILWASLFLSLLVADCHMLYALSQGHYRPPGPLKGILETSTLHAILIPALAFFSVDAKNSNRTRIVCRVFLAFAFVGSYIIGTRGLWLAIPIVLPLIFSYGDGGWKRSLRFMAVCVLCVAALVALAPVNIRNRASIGGLHDGSVIARFAMYEGATKMFLDHPLLGVGTANFAEHWQASYCPSDRPKWKDFTHPHSIFFQYLDDGGIVGFAGFAVMFGYLLRWSWRRRDARHGAILLGTTLSILLYGLTDNSLGAHEATRVLWLTVGMAFAQETLAAAERKTGATYEEHPAD